MVDFGLCRLGGEMIEHIGCISFINILHCKKSIPATQLLKLNTKQHFKRGALPPSVSTQI